MPPWTLPGISLAPVTAQDIAMPLLVVCRPRLPGRFHVHSRGPSLPLKSHSRVLQPTVVRVRVCGVFLECELLTGTHSIPRL